uniref:Uncharacterized protein n=1 Tax=Oryza brachyantha TaxID=4533 RepID=J3M5H7_ORYBR
MLVPLKMFSILSNKKPRFEEYACDLDISAKENTIAFNEGNEGSSAVCNKVGNGKIDLIVESTSKDRDHGVTSTEEFMRDKTSEQAGNQNEFIHPDVEDKEAASHLVNSDSIYDKSTDNLTFGMGDGSTNAGSSVGQGSEEVLATVLSGRANFSSDDCLDNILPISTCNSNNCVENQTCLEIAQHITLNEEVVQNVDMSTSVHSDGESLRNVSFKPFVRLINVETPFSYFLYVCSLCADNAPISFPLFGHLLMLE